MKLHLEEVYQGWSNYFPGAKIGPIPGSHVLHMFIVGNPEKFFLYNLIYMFSLIKSAVRSSKLVCGLDDAFS